MQRAPILLLLVFVTACAQFPGAGTLSDERYTITTSASAAQGGLAAAERAAFDEAGAKCTALKKTMSLVDERQSPPLWGDGTSRVDLVFVCR